MPGPAHGRLRQQVDTLRREFLQEGELPFADVLSAGCLAEALAEIRRPWKDRIFTPLVTLWVFLGQVLNADQSCRAAVARLIAHRAAAGLPQQIADDVAQGLALADVGQGHGEALALADDVGGGVGVEV